MQQNIPLAIGLVVIGSFCFASSAAVQHHAVGDHVDDRAARQSMTLRGLGSLLRHPRWWAGLGLLGAVALGPPPHPRPRTGRPHPAVGGVRP